MSTSLLAAGAERDIVTKLKDAVEKLTKSNASLTTQLSDAMKLNLEMDKKLNLKATQGKITKSRYWRRSQIERPPLKITWTWTATSVHTGSELPIGTTVRRAQHQRQATKGQQGGNISREEARQTNDTTGWGWIKLN